MKNITNKNLLQIAIVTLSILGTNLANTYFCDSNSTTKFSRFGATSICVHFYPANVKVGFNVQVDKPEVIRIEDAYTNFKDKTTDTYLIVQLGGAQAFSVMVPYIKASADKVYPLNFLNIVMSTGSISSYTWQNICDGCGIESATCNAETASTTLYDGTSGTYEQSNCYIAKCSSSNLANCDPRLFITWSGTDTDGKYLYSAGKALKQFISQNVVSLWESFRDGDITLSTDTNSLGIDVTTAIGTQS